MLFNWYLEVLKHNGFIAFLILCSCYYLLRALLFCLPNRILRSINIANRGWPPVHCDADGDYKKAEEENHD